MESIVTREVLACGAKLRRTQDPWKNFPCHAERLPLRAVQVMVAKPKNPHLDGERLLALTVSQRLTTRSHRLSWAREAPPRFYEGDLEVLPTNILLTENRVKHHVTYAHLRGTSLERDSPVLGRVLAEKMLLLPSNRKIEVICLVDWSRWP